MTGYADLPGSGPEGETCGSCKHSIKLHSRWNRWKCLANRMMWDHSKQSDIELSSKACELFKPKMERMLDSSTSQVADP